MERGKDRNERVRFCTELSVRKKNYKIEECARDLERLPKEVIAAERKTEM